MKVLVFSNSDAAGSFTGGVGWAALLADAEAGVEVVQAAFFPGSPSAAAYAAKKTREVGPDAVVVPMGTYGFTTRYVEYRVRRLLGTRLSARYKRAERGFDRRTRPAGEPPSGLNSLARKILRRTLGAEPAVRREDMTRWCVDTLEALAQFENTDVVLVIDYPATGDLLPQEAERQRFFTDLVAVANQRKFRVVRVAQALGDLPLSDALIDQIHLTPAGHLRVSAALKTAVSGSDAAM